MSDLSPSSSTTTLTMSSFERSSMRHSRSDSALDFLAGKKSPKKDVFLLDESYYERLITDLRKMFRHFTREQDRKLLLMLDVITEMKEQKKKKDEEELLLREELKDIKHRMEVMEKERKERSLVQSLENRIDQIERMTLATCSALRKMKRKSVIERIEAKQLATDDSMSDDVFEDETLRAPAQRNAPSPTGYRDYQPPRDTPSRLQHDDEMPLHKELGVPWYDNIQSFISSLKKSTAGRRPPPKSSMTNDLVTPPYTDVTTILTNPILPNIPFH